MRLSALWRDLWIESHSGLTDSRDSLVRTAPNVRAMTQPAQRERGRDDRQPPQHLRIQRWPRSDRLTSTLTRRRRIRP